MQASIQRVLSMTAVRALAATAVAGCLMTMAGVAAAQERLPGSATRDSGSSAPNAGSTTGDATCSLPIDLPISALTVDITPRDIEGLPVDPNALPVSCWDASGLEWGAVFVSCQGGCGWNCHELLRLARFCHRPLYFEATAMERCGVGGLFPAVRATGAFALDGFLWPVRMLTTQRPRSCVRTPTPHCCPPDTCGPCCR